MFADGGGEFFPERIFDVFKRVDAEAVAVGDVNPIGKDVDKSAADVFAFGRDVFGAGNRPKAFGYFGNIYGFRRPNRRLLCRRRR